MPTLIVTPSGETSNAYITEAEGDAYHTGRLNNTEWTAGIQATKESSIIWATRILDSMFEWKGSISDIDQALDWPRMGVYNKKKLYLDSEAIPKEVKDATAELAFLLIKQDRLLLSEPDSTGVKSFSLGSIKFAFDSKDRADLIPTWVQTLLAPLSTNTGATVKLRRG